MEAAAKRSKTQCFHQDAPAHFAQLKPALNGLKRIQLLKALERDGIEWTSNALKAVAKSDDHHKQLMRSTTNSQFSGVADFSDEFYGVYDLASAHHDRLRDLCLLALDECEHGFDAFETELLRFGAICTHHYDRYYRAWSKAVQGNAAARKLAKEPPPPNSDLLSHYTIIELAEDGSYKHTPYGTFFEKELEPILAAFDDLLKTLQGMQLSADQEAYRVYLAHYRHVLALRDFSQLESEWTELDRKWMDVKHPLQIVHDIEHGYGDPLRVKVIPDISIRFLDEEYKEANATIAKIQDEMVRYFETRSSTLCKNGLQGLKGCMVGIYYLPFQSGMSLHFRFSGQSIPNRSNVKTEKGIKIYFDAVATASRIVTTRELVQQIYDNADSLAPRLDAVDTIVYHVAAHEVGHGIYNLEALKSELKADTPSLLEEPRAELTALFTMQLMVKKGMATVEEMSKHLSSFAMQDLRRYSNFYSSTTRPYIISALNTYKVFEKVGYVRFNADKTKLVLDDSKAMAALELLAQQFEKVLDSEDRAAGAELETVLQEMQVENDMTRWIVAQFPNNAKKPE